MDLKTGQTVKVTITKTVNREAARKTLERLFMKDAGFAAPVDDRRGRRPPRAANDVRASSAVSWR